MKTVNFGRNQVDNGKENLKIDCLYFGHCCPYFRHFNIEGCFVIY